LIFLGNFRVCYRVRIIRRMRITRRVRVWSYFFTCMQIRVTRRVKFCRCGYGYGWTLPVGYVPVAILRPTTITEQLCQNRPKQLTFKGTCLLLDTKYPENKLSQIVPLSTPNGRTQNNPYFLSRIQ
jgi:hypothetical protein